MLCHQCGSPVEASDTTCSNCGADLVKSVKRFDIASSKGLRISQELKAIRLDDQLFPPGEKIAERYSLGELIGKGPFGEVYRARDEEIDADVALKIFKKELTLNPLHHEKFLSGARAARNRTHPNLVRIHDCGMHKDHGWVAMQYLEGLSLRKVLGLRRSKGESFSVEEVEPILGQIAAAIGGSVHGNLKPENLIFMPDMLKITDFYLLNSLDVARIANQDSQSPYVAPELHSEEVEAGAQADVYSLGIILGEMVFGSDYTPGTAPSELSGLDTICRRATAFDPLERYSDLSAMSRDLVTLMETGSLGSQDFDSGVHTPLTPPPAPPGPPPAPGAPAASTPPPAPPGPPPAPKAPANSEKASKREELSVDEESLSTVEYSRDAEIMDVLPTTEVSRTREKPPEAPKERSERAHTQTAIGAPPGQQEDSGMGKLLIGIVLLVVVIGVIAANVGQKKEEPVQLGSKEKIAKVEPKVEGKVEAPEAAETPKIAEAAEKASDTVAMAVNTQAEAVEPQNTESTETNPAETNPAEVTPEVAEKAEPKEEPKVEEPAKVEPAKTEPAAKVEPVVEAEPVAKSDGTGCPSGMRLVKRKAGNVCIDTYEYPGSGKPKTRVNWFEAKKICTSSGKRLCASSEWRSACGGNYPYGNSFDAEACNTADEDGFERSLKAVGSSKKCRSRSGAYDMSGNVHEWLEEQRIAGGSFESDEDVASCKYSSAKAPGSSAGDIGFRCCADPE